MIHPRFEKFGDFYAARRTWANRKIWLLKLQTDARRSATEKWNGSTITGLSSTFFVGLASVTILRIADDFSVTHFNGKYASPTFSIISAGVNS